MQVPSFDLWACKKIPLELGISPISKVVLSSQFPFSQKVISSSIFLGFLSLNHLQHHFAPTFFPSLCLLTPIVSPSDGEDVKIVPLSFFLIFPAFLPHFSGTSLDFPQLLGLPSGVPVAPAPLRPGLRKRRAAFEARKLSAAAEAPVTMEAIELCFGEEIEEVARHRGHGWVPPGWWGKM